MTDNNNANAQRYWARNLRLLMILLAIWWVVSYGAGIIWAESLNSITIPGTGFQVGFWFAQQGSIYVFVALIFIYARLMNKIDEEFDVHED
jgi:putative solute:sodium symporter small subunit